MATSEEWAWVAGVLEGDGCFTVQRRPHNGTTYGVVVCASMTDRDVLQRLQSITEAGTMRGPYDQGGIGKRPMFKWTVNKKADVLRIIDNVMPWLGERRAARAQELIGFADALPGHNSDKTHCIHGHPFSGDNLYEWRGKRVCKTCKSARQVERKNRLVA